MLNKLVFLALSVLSVFGDALECKEEGYLMFAVSGTSLCLPVAALEKCPYTD
jgi:hypothetical protein